METMNGLTVKYVLVYRIFPRTVTTLKDDGFYHDDGRERGHLVKSESMGRVMYHRVEELMRFKCDA
jgi:hypothetical protein